MFTAQRISTSGLVESVVLCVSLAQLRDWCAVNGHVLVTGDAAKKAMHSGACVRMLDSSGHLRF